MTYFDGKNVKIVSNNCMRNLLSSGKIAPEKDQSISSINIFYVKDQIKIDQNINWL